jgi:hypothetical protein
MQRLQILETGIGILGLALVVLSTLEAFRQYGLGQAPSVWNQRLLKLMAMVFGCLGGWWILLWMQPLPAVQRVEIGLVLTGLALVGLTFLEAFRRYGLGQARSAGRFRMLQLILVLLGLLWASWLVLSPTRALQALVVVLLLPFGVTWQLTTTLGWWVRLIEFFREDEFADRPPAWVSGVDGLIFGGLALLVIVMLLFAVTHISI